MQHLQLELRTDLHVYDGIQSHNLIGTDRITVEVNTPVYTGATVEFVTVESQQVLVYTCLHRLNEMWNYVKRDVRLSVA